MTLGATRVESAPNAGWPAAALLTGLWLRGTIPSYLQLLLTGRSVQAVGQVAATNPTVKQLGNLITLGIIAICGALVIRQLRRREALSSGALVLGTLPWLAVFVSAMENGVRPNLGIFLFPMVAVGFWVTRPDIRSALRTIGVLTTITALGSVVLGLIIPSVTLVYGLTPSASLGASYKAILPGPLLAGIYGQSNVLGLVIALGAPGILMLRTLRWRIIAAASSVIALLWCASRTAILATAIFAVVAGLAWLGRNRPAVGKWLFGAAATVGAAFVVIVPLTTTDVLAYSQRGQIWIGTLTYLHTKPILGWGPNFYANVGLYDNSLGQYAFYGHNLLVDTLVTAGVVGVVCFAVQLTAVMVRASHLGPLQVAAAGIVVTYVWCSWLEVPAITLATVSSRSWIAWGGVLVILLGRTTAAPEPAQPHRHKRTRGRDRSRALALARARARARADVPHALAA